MEEKVLTVIAETLRVDDNIVTRETAIRDIPEWDSLTFLMILSRLKDEFGIEIPIEKAMQIQTVADILSFIVKR